VYILINFKDDLDKEARQGMTTAGHSHELS